MNLTRMNMRTLIQCLLVLVLSIVWCSNAANDPCDPLVPDVCLLPYPNNYYTVSDPSYPTQLRINLSPESMPRDIFGGYINPTHLGLNEMDGFSGTSAMISYWEDLSLEGVPSHTNIVRSLDADCPTVVLDYETGERLAHWAELDVHKPRDSRRAFMIWPAAHLGNNRRIVVAMRNLRPTSSGALPYSGSAAFVALRDNSTSTLVDQSRRVHFNEIFTALEAAGVARDTLQLAWDFTTGSVESINGRALFMRDDALGRLPSGGPSYRITSVTENPSSTTRRRIQGLMSVPLYLTSPNPGSHLVISDQGLPVFQGWSEFNFTVQIPNSATTKPAALFQYGHGLFGSQSELHESYIQQMGEDYNWVQAGVDWIGMSSADVPAVSAMCLTNLSNFGIIPDRLCQAMVNQACLTRLVTGNLRNDPLLMFNGQSAVDPARRYYDGNSNGGILGAVFLALSKDIHTGVLGVPGAPYNLLVFRSVDFKSYYDLIAARFPNPIDQVNLMNLVQTVWERASPGGYCNHLSDGTTLGTENKRFLVHYGLGDAQVSWLGAQFLARSAGAAMFANNPPEVNESFYGFEMLHSDGISSGSLIQGYNFGAEPAPEDNVPPSASTDTHECVRRDPRAEAQMARFFADGYIHDTCGDLGNCQPIQPPMKLSHCPLPD